MAALAGGAYLGWGLGGGSKELVPRGRGPDLTSRGTQNCAIDAGFVVGADQEPGARADVAKGMVLETDPPGGEVGGPGVPVDVVVSSGPEAVGCPTLVRALTDEEAEGPAREGGCSAATVTEQASAEQDEGIVVGRHPPRPAAVDPGSAVDRRVANGQSRFPNVVGHDGRNGGHRGAARPG